MKGFINQIKTRVVVIGTAIFHLSFSSKHRWSTLVLALAMGLPAMVHSQLCGSISFTLENYEPCCYRLRYNNSNECHRNGRLLIDAGAFFNLTANTAGGFTTTIVTPTEIEFNNNLGFFPIGTQTVLTFCLPQGANPTLTILWDMYCGLGEGCFQDIPITSCVQPVPGSISGVKYWECGQLPYGTQPVLAGWEIQLLNTAGVVLGVATTDANGGYAFADLPPGNYICRETQRPGWTPNVPPSGEYLSVPLGSGENLNLNFGNCPSCSCDSIFMDLISLAPPSSNVCSYAVVLQNTGAYCFDGVFISLAVGQITSWANVPPGWSVQQLSPQNLQLIPQAGYVPLGFSAPLTLNATGSTVHDFTLSTSWTGNGASTLCERTFSYPCPPAPIPSCCPTGSIIGSEFAMNGDFEAGHTGFTSFGLPYYFTPGTSTAIGKYSVLQSNQVYNANSQWACVDHTISSATSKMLIVDGHNGTSNIAWRNMVSVQSGVQYAFCAYVNNLVIPTRNYDDPIVQLWINNVQVATTGSVAEIPDIWLHLLAVWTANVTGSIPIEIRLGSNADIGNDFAVDDISFRACSQQPTPCTAEFTYTANCGNVQFTNQSTPSSGLSYCWDFDGLPATCESTAMNPPWQFTACGTYNVCLTISGPACTTTTICHLVVITDITPPTVSCLQGATVNLNNNCQATIVTTDLFTNIGDNCQVASTVLSQSSFNSCGTFPVTIVVTDWCNNMTSLTCQLQVLDNKPPTIGCPPSYSTECNVNVGPNITGFATATDNCSVPSAIQITNTDLLFSSLNPTTLEFCDNYIERTWTATDGCGNMATCLQVINVQDDVAPVLTNCPQSLSVVGTLDPQGICSANLQITSPTASDNCDPTLTVTNSFNGTANASGTYPNGNTTVTFSTVDACGNMANCSFVVTVGCDACNCNTGGEITLTQGNTSFQTYCNLHGLPDSALPKFGCPAGPVTINGSFGCTGTPPTNCQSAFWYGLTDPLGNVTGGLGPLPVTLPASQTNVPGIYSFTLYTVCPGSMDTCICNIRWEQESCDSCACTIAGGSPAPNLVTNGHFDYGKLGFSSGLTCDMNCGAGTFWVDDNFQDKCNGWPNTTGAPGGANGNFMIIDGDPAIPAMFWSQPVTLVPNQNYCFSFWTASVYPISQQSFNLNVVVNGFDITGAPVVAVLGTETIEETPQLGQPFPNWINHTIIGICPPNIFGPFTIAINQVTPGSLTDFGLDDICFTKTEAVDSCCTTLEDFCTRLETAVTVSVDNSLCKATLNLGSFDGCDDYLEWVEWGDGTGQQQGNFTTGDMPMHTYALSGTYSICYLAIERDTNGLICFEKIVCDTVTLVCDSCNCQSDLTLVHGSSAIPINCNTNILYEFGCPVENISMNGFFGCVNTATGAPCLPPTQVSWILDRPGSQPDLQGTSGNSISINFAALDVSAPGIYLLNLWTLCPGSTDTCFCRIQWNQLNCDTCACGELSNLNWRPSQGAATQSIACGDSLTLGCLAPNTAVLFGGNFDCVGNNCPPPLVNWVLREKGTQQFVGSGTVNGGTGFQVLLPATYFIYPKVYELFIIGECDGVLCEECMFTIATTACPCDPATFSAGATGFFPFDGNADDLSSTNADGALNGAPLLTNGHDARPNSAYSFNGTSDWIDGGLNNRGVTNEVTVAAWVKTGGSTTGQWIAGKYDFSADEGYLLTIGANGKAAFDGRDHSGIPTGYHSSGPSQKMVNDNQWHCIVGTAGSGEWKVYVDDGNLLLNGNSALGSTAGGITVALNPFTMGRHSDLAITPPDFWMNGEIDNVVVFNRMLSATEIECYCDGLTNSEELGVKQKIRFYPNPTTGNLTLEFTGLAPKAGTLQILDLLGRTLRTETLQSGQQAHQLSIGAMPPGVYFVKILDSGEPIWTEKIMKE